MSQWIPKTAWKISNLNKRYGPSFTGMIERESKIEQVSSSRLTAIPSAQKCHKDQENKLMDGVGSPCHSPNIVETAFVLTYNTAHYGPDEIKDKYLSQSPLANTVWESVNRYSNAISSTDSCLGQTNFHSLGSSPRNKVPGENSFSHFSCFIDIRDSSDRLVKPLLRAVPLHINDLISGACLPVLPSTPFADQRVASSNRKFPNSYWSGKSQGSNTSGFSQLKLDPDKQSGMFSQMQRKLPMCWHEKIQVNKPRTDFHTELFLVTPTLQKGRNGVSALTHWGYKRVVLINFDVMEICKLVGK